MFFLRHKPTLLTDEQCGLVLVDRVFSRRLSSLLQLGTFRREGQGVRLGIPSLFCRKEELATNDSKPF